MRKIPSERILDLFPTLTSHLWLFTLSMITRGSEVLSKMRLGFRTLILLTVCLPIQALAFSTPNVESLIDKMGAAYQGVMDYQARVESTVQREDGSLETKRVLYTFKKPHRIRLDFESPNRGMVLVYPDKNGKAVIRPPGWARLFTFRIAPDNFLLQASLGQRIDQTDLGLLIRNIAHSLTDGRRGEVNVKEGEEYIRITVIADDHFREGVVTRYGFTIDTKLWLPIEVGESLPVGNLERTVFFRNLRVNIGVSDSFFEPDGG